MTPDRKQVRQQVMDFLAEFAARARYEVCRECGAIRGKKYGALCRDCWLVLHMERARPTSYRKDRLIDDDAFKRSETDDAGLD